MLLGLDVGTTNAKAVLMNEDGVIVSAASREIPIRFPAPGHAEQDAEHVFEVCKAVIRQAVAKGGVGKVHALSLSVQGDAVIPVDRNMQALLPTILGIDYRSLPQTERCVQAIGREKLFQVTGMPAHPMNSLTKMLWIKEERPDVLDSCWKLMTYADYLLAKFGADPVIDWTMASRTMAFNLLERNWSSEILDTLGIPTDKLSRPVPSGTAVGMMSASVATELGLEPGEVLLVTGGHDQTCSGIGSGAIREGTGVDSTGTSEVLLTAFDKPILSGQMLEALYPCYCHAKPDMYFTLSLNHTGGLVYQWFRDNLCENEKIEAERSGTNAFEVINRRLPPGPSGLFFLPHFKGSGSPTCRIDSRGSILGLTLETDKYRIALALLEGLTYELRLNMETMQRVGIKLNELIAVGGGAKSARWLQLKSDITQRPIRTLVRPDAACVGAAILAGIASGFWKGFEEAVRACVRYDRQYEPDSAAVRAYEDNYHYYLSFYRGLLDLYGKAADASSPGR